MCFPQTIITCSIFSHNKVTFPFSHIFHSPKRYLYLENLPSTTSAHVSQHRWVFEGRAYHRRLSFHPESAWASLRECVTDFSSWRRPKRGEKVIHNSWRQNCVICCGQSEKNSNYAFTIFHSSIVFFGPSVLLSIFASSFQFSSYFDSPVSRKGKRREKKRKEDSEHISNT